MILIVLAVAAVLRPQSSLGRPVARQGDQRVQEGLEGAGRRGGGFHRTTRPGTDAAPIEAPRPPQRIGAPAPKFERQPAEAKNRKRVTVRDRALNSAARVPSSHGGSHWFESSSAH